MQGLKPIETEIILDEANKKQLKLNELLIFPHGLDGLHIWEAGIILARYIVFNSQLFSNKDILEVGTGVGIGGLAALKYTECKRVDMTDYNQDVLANIKKNSEKNSISKQRYDVFYLNWFEYAKFDKKYDIIIGSDIIYSGAPLKELYLLISKSLNKGGKAYIIIPSQRFKGEVFLKYVEDYKEFTVEKIALDQTEYYLSPLKDQTQGFKTYPGLKELQFWVYIFTKI
ncbi:hypothetical protein ABPG72_015886 [Tetrahymena utriculariae]